MPGLENYKPVKQRIFEFRADHPDWTIYTELEERDGFWFSRTTIRDSTGHPIANGHAVERNNKPFDAEKAETSSVGRALVFAGWTDSLELSHEERERAEGVHKPQKQAPPTRTPEPRPVTPESVQRQVIPGSSQITKPATLDDLLRLSKPVTSAPKPFWREFVAELVAAAEHEDRVQIPWRDLTGGKGFNDLTTIELKTLVEDVDKWLHEPEVE